MVATGHAVGPSRTWQLVLDQKKKETELGVADRYREKILKLTNQQCSSPGLLDGHSFTNVAIEFPAERRDIRLS